MKQPSTFFPIDEWALSEAALQPQQIVLAETLFSQANGYIGTRGTFEETMNEVKGSCEGTYINGLYVREPIHYEENAHGFARNNHKMIQAPSGKLIDLWIDGAPFTATPQNCIGHQRFMHFKRGVLERATQYQIEGKGRIEVKSRRLVCLARPHLMAIEYHVTPLDFSADIRLSSGLDAAYGGVSEKDENDPRAGHLSIRESLVAVTSQSDNTQLRMLCRIRSSQHLIASGCRHQTSAHLSATTGEQRLTHEIVQMCEAGQSLAVTKWIAYHDGEEADAVLLMSKLAQSLKEAPDFETLIAEQEAFLARFWHEADMGIEGDSPRQQGIRFNLFHILQSTGKDGKRAIAAKGLSGPGYDGHYFWDTEIYIIPFYVFTQPEVARALLTFRLSLLEASRQRAREMAHQKGALYAWRTIGGEECSAFFPAGTAQYHINAAIAYALEQYLNATEDWDFMREGGAEMLFETARIWAQIGHFSEAKDGQFCINEVTGPDEYSAMVDNNFYTNAMARMHLRFAASAAQTFQSRWPEDFAKLAAHIDLSQEEIVHWQRAAQHMYLPFDEQRQIHPQDDGFLGKPRWDFEHTPPENYPLLLHYHPLTIYRHQVLKQADVVLAMALLGSEFSADIRRNNLAFYTPLTTHDSTLSTCIYSIESARAGLMQEAYLLFDETARMDLDNRHHNTEYGLHTACMAGSWMAIVMGFAGLEVKNGQLHFAPKLPASWKGYHFSLRYRGNRILFSMSTQGFECQLCEGVGLSMTIGEIHCTLSPQHTKEKISIENEQAA